MGHPRRKPPWDSALTLHNHTWSGSTGSESPKAPCPSRVLSHRILQTNLSHTPAQETGSCLQGGQGRFKISSLLHLHARNVGPLRASAGPEKRRDLVQVTLQVVTVGLGAATQAREG